MPYASLGKMVWLSLLAQPGRSLTREDVDTLKVSLHVLWTRRIEIVIQRPTCHVVEIKRPGLASFGIDQGNTPSPLIDMALIHTQCSNFADAQSCEVGPARRCLQSGGRMLFHKLFEHKALL